MENSTYTFSFFGRYQVGINKFLLPIKISLFCWFAGSQTTMAFISVYLKHQGLTISHLSVMVTISVAFQFIVGMISGMFADRIGRVKPFLFMHGSIFLETLICFIVMPKIDGCDTQKITLHCIDEKLTAQDSCQIPQDTFHKDACFLIDSENATHYDENENCPFVSLLLQMDFSIENYHKNEISGFCLYQVNFKNYSSKDIPPCEIQKCEAFHVVCSKKGISSDCLKSRSSWILVYGILVVLYNTSRTNIYRFFDIIAMDLSNQYNSDFGKQRLCSVLGLSVGPLLAGFISHKITSNESDKSYTPVFVCAAIFAAFAFIPVWKVNPKFHKPAATVWKKSFEFVMNLEIILFLILLLTMGISFGFIYIYGNWYLQDLGATDLLLGVSTGVSAICALPFLYTSKWIFNKVGLRNFFVLSLLSYAFYCFSFSLMREPWLAVGIKLVYVFAYHLFWVASVQYCDEVAPIELQATMKVLAGTLHYNIGWYPCIA
ncbi:hypothetical protein AVEN_25298-1 [Araneus ventricosus]|uniref:Major facilitator superfamily associated domain-containing protein n=1 Tax=Araneus ventricosus TaxID=182803 RepID=A0A4Y2PTE6_ARAVE|nr:hypothetical protein AVEN_25298-1 [Araneus ventricosus]